MINFDWYTKMIPMIT